MQRILLALIFLFAVVQHVAAQNPTNSKEDSLSDVFLKQMLLGNNFEVAKEYKFDIEMQYEQTYQNSSKKNENIYSFLSTSNPSIASLLTNKEDSTKVVLDFQNRFIVLLNTSVGGKTGVTIPIETLNSEIIKNSSFNKTMSSSQKTGKTVKINNFDCEEYFFEDDSDKVTYYLTPIIKEVPFSSAPLVSMTKHNFNTEGHIIRLISEKKSNKEVSILEYKSTNRTDYSINTEEYTMLGGKNGLFGGLMDSTVLALGDLFQDENESFTRWDEKDGKFGYVRQFSDSSQVIIPYEYDAKEAVGIVNMMMVKKEEKWAIFNDTKQTFISPFKYFGSNSFSNERFAVMFENGLYGLVDTTGKEYTEGIYSDFTHYNSFLDRISVAKESLWGVTDKYGKEIIPFIYDEAIFFDEKTAIAQTVKNGKWGLIDKDNNVKIQFLYDEIKYYGSEINYFAVKKTNQWGVIDETGKIIIPFEYQDINGISELISVKKNNKWGLIDIKNKGIVPYIYDDMRFLSESLVPVKKGTKWGYIDTNGKIIIPFIYDEANPFTEGVASVILKEKYRVIDKTGKCTQNCN